MRADWMRLDCAFCRHYDETAYAFPNHHASGRICEHRVAYEPDLSPFRDHPKFPHVTHSGSCCRAFEERTNEQVQVIEGRLFA
jgi:hypothetical protein